MEGSYTELDQLKSKYLQLELEAKSNKDASQKLRIYEEKIVMLTVEIERLLKEIEQWKSVVAEKEGEKARAMDEIHESYRLRIEKIRAENVKRASVEGQVVQYVGMVIFIF